jgi:hypothetical protein
MKLDKENSIYAGVAGAIIGVCYLCARAWFTSDYTDITAMNLIGAGLIGAIAGIAAFAVRFSTEDDGK